MKIFEWHNWESSPRAPHILLTNSLRHPLHFAPDRKPFKLKSLVSVCSTQLSVEIYKLYVCRFVSCFTRLAEMFPGQTCSADQTWREALSVLKPVPSSYSVGNLRINTCGIYKRNTLNTTGYWKAITGCVLKVLISFNIAYKPSLLKCYSSAKNY